jgi:hypothetical protein
VGKPFLEGMLINPFIHINHKERFIGYGFNLFDHNRISILRMLIGILFKISQNNDLFGKFSCHFPVSDFTFLKPDSGNAKLSLLFGL